MNDAPADCFNIFVSLKDAGLSNAALGVWFDCLHQLEECDARSGIFGFIQIKPAADADAAEFMESAGLEKSFNRNVARSLREIDEHSTRFSEAGRRIAAYLREPSRAGEARETRLSIHDLTNACRDFLELKAPLGKERTRRLAALHGGSSRTRPRYATAGTHQLSALHRSRAGRRGRGRLTAQTASDHGGKKDGERTPT